ncbi:mandelate racemase/muconate lactonizing enzyme family protein [Bacillus salipaludis]|uniref:Mandelate racemase/muconate lactonizing enzyme family protein n=1 Tax=Bacillus salipaludis TaxID=2547811 RepID=A0ABW8RBX6_9BACI
MNITKIEVIPFSVPINSFADAYTGFATSNAVLVKIHAEDGTIGFGEACAWEPEFYGETIESVSSTIDKYVSPHIIGQNPFNINHIMSIIDAKIARLTCVKEGIDLALHDLVGKLLGVPVYTLLGGSFRDKIPVASEIGIDTPEEMAKNALRVVDLGIKVIKIKGSHDMNLDIKRIYSVREAVGDQVELRLDPNAAWTTMGTIKTMNQLEECKLQLLEQPIPGWDLKGMSHIRNSIGIPLMADEGIWTPQDVIKIAENGAADLINIKIAKSCGLHLGKKIEAVAETVGIPCIAGTEIEPGFSLIAKLHFAASIKEHPIASEFTELTLLKANILNHKIEIEDGCVKVPNGPGFGVELDEEIFERYIVKC